MQRRGIVLYTKLAPTYVKIVIGMRKHPEFRRYMVKMWKPACKTTALNLHKIYNAQCDVAHAVQYRLDITYFKGPTDLVRYNRSRRNIPDLVKYRMIYAFGPLL